MQLFCFFFVGGKFISYAIFSGTINRGLGCWRTESERLFFADGGRCVAIGGGWMRELCQTFWDSIMNMLYIQYSAFSQLIPSEPEPRWYREVSREKKKNNQKIS